MTETCTVMIVSAGSHWSTGHKCGRPVESDGLCKLHLRVKAKREERNRAWRTEYDESARLDRVAAEIARALGTQVEAHYDSISKAKDGRMVVPLDWLADLAGIDHRNVR